MTKRNIMKKKSILISIVLCLMTGGIFAQTSAEQFVKQTVDKLKKHKNTAITFDYRIDGENAKSEESYKGKGYMQNDAYKLEIDEQQIISDGKTLWTYQENVQEVMISNADDNSDAMLSPLHFLTHYSEDYKLRYLPSGEKGAKCVEMTSPKAAFSKVVLTIDEKKQELKNMRVNDTNGNILIIDIKELTYDHNWPSSFFTFDAKTHPDVEVIDMR